MLRIIPLQGDLIQATVQEVTADSQHDFSQFKVVSPSKRLLFFIKHRMNQTITHSHFPPELLTIDQFVSDLFNKNHQGFKMINTMESLLVIYQTVKDGFQDTVYTGGKISACFPDFFPWALVIQKALEELLVEAENIEQVNRDIYAKFAELGEYHLDYKDFITRLPELVEQFRKRLLRNKLFTRGMAYRMVAGLAERGVLNIPGDKTLVFTGMGMLNASEEKILKFLIERRRVRILIKSDAAAIGVPNSPFRVHQPYLKMVNGSPPIDERNIQWNQFSHRVRLYCQSNIESQMLQVADILEKAIGKRDGEQLKKIAVILPDSSSLIPFVHGVASRLISRNKPIPFNITLGYPFARTPLYQLLRFILRAYESRRNGDLFHKDYLNLIRHPYVKLSGTFDNEQEPLKRGIHLIEEVINRENLIYFKLEEIENRVEQILEKSTGLDPELSREVNREIHDLHTHFIITRDLTLAELGTFLKQAVLSIEKNRSGDLFLGEYMATAVQTLNQIIEFSRENEDEVGYSDFSSLISLISYCFSESFVYFEGSPLKGIQVMGVLESRGLGFDEVILVDVMEGVIPQRLKYDPLLPFDIRKIFQIRSYREWETLFAFNLFSLIGSAKKVHLLWMDTREGMQKNEKSRFIERIIYETEKQESPPPLVVRGSCPFSLNENILLKVDKTEAILDRIRQTVFSPSMLETYIHCPLRFYFSHILGLRERDEPAEDPDSGELGTLIHSVLEAFYRNRQLPRSFQEIEEKLEALLKKEFEIHGFGISSGTGRIRFWVLKEKLMDFIQKDCRRIKGNGIRIQDFEKRISVNFSLPFSPVPVSFRGRIDRIEKEGQVVRLIDYKTGTAFIPRVTPAMIDYQVNDLCLQSEPVYFENLLNIRKSYKNFQILLYFLLVVQGWGLDGQLVDAAYIFLKPAEDYFRPVFVYGKKQEKVSDSDKKHIMDNFYHNLMEIIRDVFEREIFLADPRDAHYCSFCPFRIPCGNPG